MSKLKKITQSKNKKLTWLNPLYKNNHTDTKHSHLICQKNKKKQKDHTTVNFKGIRSEPWLSSYYCDPTKIWGRNDSCITVYCEVLHKNGRWALKLYIMQRSYGFINDLFFGLAAVLRMLRAMFRTGQIESSFSSVRNTWTSYRNANALPPYFHSKWGAQLGQNGSSYSEVIVWMKSI